MLQPTTAPKGAVVGFRLAVTWKVHSDPSFLKVHSDPSFRFSGGTSGLSIGHCSPEAAGGGTIGLVRDGDRIRIDIPQRGINLLVDDAELTRRRTEQEAKGWKPAQARPRKVSTALKAYALLDG